MSETIKLNINGVMFDVEKETISQAVEKGEFSITNDDYIIKTKADQEAYINNVTGERYRAGKEKAEKDAVNPIAQKYGIELDDTKKTVENLVNALSEKLKTDYTKEPSKKIQELEEDRKKAMQLVQDKENAYNELKGNYENTIKGQKINTLLISAVPKNEKGETIKTKIPLEDITLLFQNRYKIDFDENGNEYVEKDGKKIQNPSTLNNLTVKDVFSNFVKDYISENTGGSGDGDKTGDNHTGTLEAFVKEMREKGITGSDINREMQKRIKEGTLKV